LRATINKIGSAALHVAGLPDNEQIRPNPAGQPMPMTDPSPSTANRALLRVLLLDDDTFMLSLLEDMLAELGNFEVLCESDAKSALRRLATDAPGLLVCDLSMPDMDGIEFLHAAAEAGFRGHVMLLSGMDSGVRRSAERLAKAHGLQVLGAYKKPISQAELQDALTTLLRPSGPGDGNVYNVTTHSGK
jgi:CheY-like chemotaxis protein